MAQTKTIQLLRSSQVYASLEAAKEALLSTTVMTGRKDGELLLARYNYTKDNVTTIKSLIGVYHAAPDLANGTPTGVTFIEDLSTAAGTSAALQAEVDAIEASVGLGTDGTKTDFSGAAVTDNVISASDTLIGAIQKVANAIAGMDKNADAVAGQVVTTIAQANGSVTETKANVKDLQLGGYSKDANATGAIGSTDNVNTALSKLENAIDANDVHSDDQSITVTDDVDGGTNIEVNVDGTTIVKDATSHALKSGLKLAKITTGLSTNVKEAYQLQDASGNQIGNTQIDIYKDSALKEVYLGSGDDTIDASTGVITKNTVTEPQSMNFAYQLADGTYSLIKVDVSRFLAESEFGDGLQVSNAGVVSVKVGNGLEIDGTSKAVNVKIDSTSESFLTVGANGVKLSGVQSAINAAIEGLDVTDTAVTGQYVSAVSETDGEISVSRANVADAVLTGYTKGSTAPQSPAVAATDDVKGAIAKLEWQIDAVNAGVSNLDAVVTSSDGTNVQVKVTEVDGKITAVNVTDNSINSSDLNTKIATLDADLDASGTAQHNGTFVMSGVTEVDGVLTAVDSVEVENAGAAAAAKATIDAYTVNNKAISTSPVLDGSDIALTGYTKGSDATAIAATDTVNQAVSKLENQIDAVETTANGALQSVSSGNGAIAVGTEDANHNQTIGLVLDTATAANNITSDMLQITSNGLMMKDAWDCGTY